MISKQNGFSLLEVMISFILVGVASLGLVKFQVYVEQKSDYAVKSINALHFAETQMEYYRTRASDVSGATNVILFSEIDGSTHCKNEHHSEPLTNLVPDFDMECTVTNASGSLSSALKLITITVGWDDRTEVRQSVSLKTMLSKYSEFDD